MEGKATQGTHGAVWETLKSMGFMYKHLKAEVDRMEAQMNANELPSEVWKEYSTRVDAGWLKLTDYHSLIDESPIYRLAIFLHPNYRFEYFEEHWQEYKSWIAKARSAIKQEYERYERVWLAQAEEEAAAEEAAAEEDSSPPEDDVFKAFEAFGRPTNFARRRGKRRKIESSQLNSYWEAGPTTYTVANPIEWWHAEGSQWPVLQRMAFDVFTIPAMSAEPERLFSYGRRKISYERTRLSDDTIEAEMCQKAWLVNKIV